LTDNHNNISHKPDTTALLNLLYMILEKLLANSRNTLAHRELASTTDALH